MFFPLPISAVVPNWIGTWLVDMLSTGFKAVDEGRTPSIKYSGIGPKEASALKNRPELAKLTRAVLKAYVDLASAERVRVKEALDDQLNVPDLYAGMRSATTRKKLAAPIQKPLDDLSREAFSALTDFGLRKQSFNVHFGGVNGRSCSFCGYESIDGPRIRNADWDHYLARTLYPFAAFNLRNLAPMSDGCNRAYKGSKDILRKSPALRRLCFDPYMAPSTPIRVHLRNSVPLGLNGRPHWKIEIIGDPQRVQTWDAVFKVRQRWEDHLNPRYEACLRRVANCFSRSAPPDNTSIADMLEREAVPALNPPIPGDDLLSIAIFDMWHNAFQPGSPYQDDLASLFRDVVKERGRH